MRKPLLLLAGLLSGATPVAAQSLQVGWVTVGARHELLDQMNGAVVQFVLGAPERRVRLVAGLEHLAGTQRNRVGIPCEGLINPADDCAPRPFTDDGRLTVGSVGPRIALARRARFELAGFAQARLGTVRAIADASDHPYRGTWGATVFGGDVGASASWRPLARLPVALTASASVGGYRPLAEDQVVDAAAPFNRGIGFDRLQIGLTWR